jgi:hypothetical protein
VSIILDLDNCISDDGWRIQYIDWSTDDPDERYRKYHDGMKCDKFANAHLLDTSQSIIIFTSRPERYRSNTENWLAAHNIKFVELCMRPHDDHRPSLQLKASFLAVNTRHITCAYDDRPDIVEMYRLNGIQAEVVKIHDICAYTPPKTALSSPPDVPALLRAAAKTFEERNALYGDNYKHFGHVMAATFPNGLTVADAESWNRLGLLVQTVSKMTRYAANFERGGHQDSAHDLCVYAAMLEELTR